MLIPFSLVRGALDLDAVLLVVMLVAMYVIFHLAYFLTVGLDEDDQQFIQSVRSHVKIRLNSR